MTASEKPSPIDSLKKSAERLAVSATMIGAKVLSDPKVAGPSEKIQRELRQAKAVGQFTVLSASAKVKQSLKKTPASPTVETEPESATEPAPEAPRCVPDYVNMSASQIVPLLKGLTDEERAEVLTYEQATRGRKTILAALNKNAS